MSKNTAEKPGFRRYSPRARMEAPRKNFLDHMGAWLGSRSRLVRSVIAGFIALIMTGALVLIAYGILLSITTGTFATLLTDHPEILTVILLIMVIIGMGFYWVGWRVLIGFDRGETVLEPGRSAAMWVILGIIVLVTMVVLAAFTVADAMS